MEIETKVESVEQSQTRGGNTRYTVRDAEGREFATFARDRRAGDTLLRGPPRPDRVPRGRPQRLPQRVSGRDLSGERARPRAPEPRTDPDEVAWSTAVEAAPWVLGSNEPEREVAPEELFEARAVRAPGRRGHQAGRPRRAGRLTPGGWRCRSLRAAAADGAGQRHGCYAVARWPARCSTISRASSSAPWMKLDLRRRRKFSPIR